MLIILHNKAINFCESIKLFINQIIEKKIWELLFLYINFFSIIFFYFLYFNSKKEAVEFILIYNFISILTLSFSANSRNISILHAGAGFSKGIVKFRIYTSLGIFLFFYFFQFYFSIDESIFFFTIILLTLSFWVIEPIVVLYEIKKINLKPSKLLIVLHLFFFLNFIFIYFFYSQKNLKILFFLIISFINIFYILYFFNSKKIKKIKNSYKKNYLNFRILNLAFISSFSIILSVFIIRYLFSEKLDSISAADAIFCLSVISFPGSLIAGFYGAKYLSKEIILPSIFKYVFVCGLVLFFAALFIFLTNLQPLYNNFLKLFCLSLIGSFFMFIAQSYRILHISSMNMQSIFLKDIFFHIFLVFLTYLFIIYFNVYLLFFIYPFFALIIYCSSVKFYDLYKK